MPACLSPVHPPFRLDTDRLDQHLTTAPAVIAELINAAALRRDDTVLDIGAGTGLITRAVAACAGNTVAIELDRRFEPYLRPLHGRCGITVRWTDFRTIAPHQATAVVANPPFAATEHLVDWLGRLPRLRGASLIVGRHFSLAATALPGTQSYTRLSLHLQAAFTARIDAAVAPASFHPSARTAAAIVTLTPADATPLTRVLDTAFTARAGTRLRELTNDLHRQQLLNECLPAIRERLAPYLPKRLQQLTNEEVSQTISVLTRG